MRPLKGCRFLDIPSHFPFEGGAIRRYRGIESKLLDHVGLGFSSNFISPPTTPRVVGMFNIRRRGGGPF